MLARVQAEQAEVDFDVAIGALQTAHGENPLARSAQIRIVIVETREFQRRVGFHGRADFGRSVRVNVEAAIRQLARQDGAHGFLDHAAATADSTLRSAADAATARAE